MSECGICLAEFDGEPAEVWVEKIVKARKKHKCCECDKVIPRGAQYQRVNMIHDSTPSVWHTCLICTEIAGVFYCNGRMIACLWEAMEEEEVYRGLTTACFDRLQTPEAKAELRRRWMQHKGLKPNPEAS